MASAGKKQKQAEYRHSDAGRLARRMYNMQPEVKMKVKMRRQAKQKMKRGY
jgi:hypothetical protein